MNENKNAMPMSYSEGDLGTDGLSKLEYAAIHIAAGLSASESELYSDHVARMAISIARQIFEQLEDDSTVPASDSGL